MTQKKTLENVGVSTQSRIFKGFLILPAVGIEPNADMLFFELYQRESDFVSTIHVNI